MVVMANSGLIQMILVLATLLFFYDKNVMAEGRNISQQEYSQMKAYLKMMNKPAIMSIKTDDGDVYDCVDIYKQPAFDHPWLKNHTLQMEPSSYPNGVRQKNIDFDIQNIGLKDGGCPNGTVPIRRTRESDFLMTAPGLRYGTKLKSNVDHYYTASRTPTGAYVGARAIMNVWNPKIGNAGSFSASQLWISAGPAAKVNTIEVGLLVDPELYGDSKTRLVVYWTADNYWRTGCFNIKCPGFVQVNGRIPVDGSFDRVSTYRGQQYEVKFDVFKDPKTGNWFLLKDDLTIGYWPSSLFNYLNTQAQNVHWGGMVSQCGGCPFPQMGSGYFPNGGYGVASYMKGLQVIDNTNMVLRDPINCVVVEDRKSCYRLQQNPLGTGTLTGYHIFYGGPGGSC